MTDKPLSLAAAIIGKSSWKDKFDAGLLTTWTKAPLFYDYQPCYGPRVNVLGDIDQYRGYYQPANWPGYGVQRDAFDQLLALAESEKIPIAVISMPLTQANLDLLDPALLAAYRHDVVEISQKHHVAFFNLQKSNRFDMRDFEDSAHLNEFGGKKFFDFLAHELCGLRQGGKSFVANKSDSVATD